MGILDDAKDAAGTAGRKMGDAFDDAVDPGWVDALLAGGRP